MIADYSTINRQALAALDIYRPSSNRRVSKGEEMGSGCFLDAPGYPSYFIKHIYTPSGDDPTTGPRHLIVVPGEEPRTIRDGNDGTISKMVLRLLWKPLPIDHPRVQSWIRYVYSYMKNCYTNTDPKETWPEEDKKSFSSLVIWPVPSYKLERFRDEWRATEVGRVEAANEATLAYYSKFATPENHNAVRLIREFYPSHQPDLSLISAVRGSYGSDGNWWETLAEKPTPENCPGEFRWSPMTGNSKHPVGGTCCQVCGWRKPKE
jgi:hypothetical protein